MKWLDYNLKNEYIVILFFILSFILYGNTLTHDYALDDAIVISENTFTRNGFSGIKDIVQYDTFTGFFGKEKKLVAGGRYRPFSLITFAIEYAIFGLHPHVSHFINILLYALIVSLLFLTFDRILKKNKNPVLRSIPFLAALLFLFHPIHTEVVANIKGRDEILAFLGATGALLYTLKYLEEKKWKYLMYIFLAFSMGIFSKENTITFLAVIPLTIYFFTPYSWKESYKAYIPIVLSSLIFLLIRRMVLGPQPDELPKELMNNPFMENGNVLGFLERMPTLFLTYGIYLKLLIFPHPLTYDYYPKQIPIIEWNDWRALLPLILYSALFIIALIKFKKRNIISYGILFYLITFSIVSNVFFPVGTFMNERFMFISSFGFCLLLAYFFAIVLGNQNNSLRLPVLLLLVLLLSGYTYKTIHRNKAWKDDFTLFLTDVKTSSKSAKSNTSAGGKLIERAKEIKDTSLRNQYLRQAIEYLEKAIRIHPTYADAKLLLGNAHFEYNKNFEKSIQNYMDILKRNPQNDHAFRNIMIVANAADSISTKLKIYEFLYQNRPENFDVNYNLGVLYCRFLGELDKGIPLLEKAVSIKPKSKEAIKDLGVAYGMKNDIEKSLDIFLKALEMYPNDSQIHYNIGISLARMGEMEKAEQYFQKARQLNPELK